MIIFVMTDFVDTNLCKIIFLSRFYKDSCSLGFLKKQKFLRSQKASLSADRRDLSGKKRRVRVYTLRKGMYNGS